MTGMATYLLLPSGPETNYSTRSSVNEKNDETFQAKRNTAFYEAMSAGLSFFALCVCVGFLAAEGGKYNTRTPLWWSDTTLVDLNNTAQRGRVDNFTDALAGMCLDNSAGEFNKATQSIGDAVRFGSFELQILPSTRLIATGFSPVWMLFVIFYVSLCFQGKRAYAFYASEDAKKLSYPVWNPPEYLFWDFFYALWYLMQCFLQSKESLFKWFYRNVAPRWKYPTWNEKKFPFWDFNYAILYIIQCISVFLHNTIFLNPFVWLPFNSTSKVEITRWLEYALTSPLQIWIVASLFFIGDVLHLFAAAGAQLGLVLVGALIEYYNGKISTKLRKHRPDKATNAKICAGVLCVLAWVIHASIWLPLILLFRYQLDKSESCLPMVSQGNWEAAKGAVQATVYLQLVLFSVFGLVLTASTASACVNPKADKAAVQLARVHNGGIYAVLSVLAKTALDVGFLLVVGLRAR